MAQRGDIILDGICLLVVEPGRVITDALEVAALAAIWNRSSSWYRADTLKWYERCAQVKVHVSMPGVARFDSSTDLDTGWKAISSNAGAVGARGGER